MDDMVIRAMTKWPNVPACFGWLGLDMRGNWYMRDEHAQAAGAFGSGQPHCKGSRLQHEKLIEFIGRNYAPDAQGRWYFQNGPQRVFVELEQTPLIWRLDEHYVPTTHTGVPSTVEHCCVDEQGYVYLKCLAGFGLIHSLDVERAAAAIESARWSLQQVDRGDLAAQYAFVRSPLTGA